MKSKVIYKPEDLSLEAGFNLAQMLSIKECEVLSVEYHLKGDMEDASFLVLDEATVEVCLTREALMGYLRNEYISYCPSIVEWIDVFAEGDMEDIISLSYSMDDWAGSVGYLLTGLDFSGAMPLHDRVVKIANLLDAGWME